MRYWFTTGRARAAALGLMFALMFAIACLAVHAPHVHAAPGNKGPAPAPNQPPASTPQDAADAIDSEDTPSLTQPAITTPDATELARSHFQKGVQYYGEGDYAAALVEFQRAYAKQPNYRLLYNLGQVSYELRDYAAAERYFRSYLLEGDADIAPERRAELKSELDGLRGRVGSLQLHTDQVGAEWFIDDHAVGSSPLGQTVRVSAGRRRVHAELPGYQPVSRVVDIAGGEELVITLPFLQPLAATTTAPHATAPIVESGSPTWPIWTTGIATGVLALGAAGMGYWAHVDANSYAQALDRPTSRAELDAFASNARNKAMVSDVLLGAAVVAGTVTIVLIITAEHAPERAQARLRLTPSGVAGTF